MVTARSKAALDAARLMRMAVDSKAPDWLRVVLEMIAEEVGSVAPNCRRSDDLPELIYRH
jgi:hypothetical protein